MATDRGADGRVVVGVEHSLGAYQALRYSVAEARRRDAALLVVHVVNRPVDSVRDQVRAVFVEALGGPPTDVRVEIVAAGGAVGAALVGVANRESDLLVIGGSARRRLLRLRAARVAAYCAAHAGCPVVIVPPSALARAGRDGRLARSAVRELEQLLSRAGRDKPRHVRPTFINARWVRRRSNWAA